MMMLIEDPPYYLPPPVSWWELMCARIFGKREESTTEGLTVVTYVWRGRFYITRIKVDDAALNEKIPPTEAGGS